MGSKLSSFLSNLYLNVVEKSIIPKYEKNLDILFYGRYVDDCILIIKKDSYQKLLQKFNTYAEKLQFTVEKMQKNCINFLDVTLEISDSNLKIWNYTKPQNSSKITDY